MKIILSLGFSRAVRNAPDDFKVKKSETAFPSFALAYLQLI
jgi:hypothetical protein